jgi:hypothetical protein
MLVSNSVLKPSGIILLLSATAFALFELELVQAIKKINDAGRKSLNNIKLVLITKNTKALAVAKA